MRGRGHQRIGKALATATAAVGLVSIASAQNEEAGKVLNVTLGQTLQYSDNIDLIVDPQQNVFRSSTLVGLSYSDITRTQTLRFRTSGSYQIDNDGQSDVSEPAARLFYALNGANSRLSFSASYQQRDLDDAFIPFIIDTIDNGAVSEIARIEGGVRTDTDYDFTFETGLQSSVGFRLNLSHQDRRFSGVNIQDLSPSTTDRVNLLTTFRINPQITARLTANARNFVSESDELVDRLEVNYGAGLALNVTPATTLDLSLGQRRVESEIGEDRQEVKGLSYSAALTRDLPNGNIGVNFSSLPTLNGRDNTLRVNRSMALRREGTLSYGAGVSKIEGFSAEPLVFLSYEQPLRQGRFGVELNQQANTDETNNTATILTRISANYATPLSPTVNWTTTASLTDFSGRDLTGEERRRYNLATDFSGRINDISSWSLGATYASTRSSNPTSSRKESRYSVEMSYIREVAQDWNMVASYRHTSILDSEAADRKSNAISLGLRKTFTVRP